MQNRFTTEVLHQEGTMLAARLVVEVCREEFNADEEQIAKILIRHMDMNVEEAQNYARN